MLLVLLVMAEGQKGGHDHQAQKSKNVKVFLCFTTLGIQGAPSAKHQIERGLLRKFKMATA